MRGRGRCPTIQGGLVAPGENEPVNKGGCPDCNIERLCDQILEQGACTHYS
jgi:hypothetical protein